MLQGDPRSRRELYFLLIQQCDVGGGDRRWDARRVCLLLLSPAMLCFVIGALRTWPHAPCSLVYAQRRGSRGRGLRAPNPNGGDLATCLHTVALAGWGLGEGTGYLLTVAPPPDHLHATLLLLLPDRCVFGILRSTTPNWPIQLLAATEERVVEYFSSKR